MRVRAARTSADVNVKQHSFVIPGRASRREPGIHTHDGGYGFRARRFAAPGMTTERKTLLRILAAQFAPELCWIPSLPNEEGAGKTGCWPHPRSRVQKNKTHTSIQVRPGRPGLPCAMVLRLIARSPRSTGLVSLRRGAFRSLDPSVGGQDHAPSPSASLCDRLAAFASIAPRLTFRDEWP